MIYFALNKTTDLIKIGYSSNVVQRIQQLRAKKNDVVLLGCVLGDRDREKQMHEWFFRFHDNGEWFTNDPEIVEYVVANRLEPRLVVTEHAWMSFKDDYHGASVPREMLNRIVALANERRMSFSSLAMDMLEQAVSRAEQEALDARDRKAKKP